MLLEDHIREDLILCQLGAQKKDEAILEMADLFRIAGIVDEVEKFVDTIRRREKLESTAIGNGTAIPHGRSDTVKELRVAFARSKEGVDFRALDGRPVYLIFMVAAPKDIRKEYLQIVAKLARLSKSKVMRQTLMKAEGPKEVMELVRDFDNMVLEDIKVKTKNGRILYRE